LAVYRTELFPTGNRSRATSLITASSLVGGIGGLLATGALLDGNWFGSGNFDVQEVWPRIPCFVQIELPKRTVLSHIALYENQNGPTSDAFAVQAWIESRTIHKNLTAYEKRQLARGFWHTVVKVRGNKDSFHVHEFDTPVYTRKVRVFLLTGHSGLNEIELYGKQPERPSDAK